MTHLERRYCKTARIKTLWPRFHHQILRQEFLLEDLMRSSLFRGATGQRVVKHCNLVELSVAAEVIGMGVGVNHYHRFVSHSFYGLAKVADSTTTVDQGRLLVSNDQIDDGRLVVARLVENEEIVSNLIDLEPILADGDPFEIGIRRLGLSVIPVFGHQLCPLPVIGVLPTAQHGCVGYQRCRNSRTTRLRRDEKLTEFGSVDGAKSDRATVGAHYSEVPQKLATGSLICAFSSGCSSSTRPARSALLARTSLLLPSSLAEALNDRVRERGGILFRNPVRRIWDTKPGNVLGDLAHHVLKQRAGITDRAPGREDRDSKFPVALKCLQIVLSVTLECAVQLKASSHCSWCGVRESVASDIDRGRIEATCREERLQVLEFAPSDQHFCNVACVVKGEVPYPRVGLDHFEY